MLKKLSLILILLGMVIGLTIPAAGVHADGANQITFTAVSYSGCVSGEAVDFCGAEDVQVKPNGETVIIGFKDTMLFTATDDRWTATCLFSADPFTLDKPNGYPLMGTFVCTPTNPKYAGGYWAGWVHVINQSDKTVFHWAAKGYGTLDGLLVNVFNTMGHNFSEVPPGTTDAGVITELPGYVPIP